MCSSDLIDAMRGDQLVVEAFPFESTLAAQPINLDPPKPPAAAPTGPLSIPVPAWLQNLIGKQVNMMVVAGVAGGVLLSALGGGFFLWRRRKKKKAQATLDGKGQLSSPAADAEKEMEARLAEQAAEQQRLEAEAILSLKLPAVSTKRTDVLTKHIAQEVKKDPAAMAHVVRSWLNGEYQR